MHLQFIQVVLYLYHYVTYKHDCFRAARVSPNSRVTPSAKNVKYARLRLKLYHLCLKYHGSLPRLRKRMLCSQDATMRLASKRPQSLIKRIHAAADGPVHLCHLHSCTATGVTPASCAPYIMDVRVKLTWIHGAAMRPPIHGVTIGRMKPSDWIASQEHNFC